MSADTMNLVVAESTESLRMKTNTGAAILNRLFDPEGDHLPADAARFLARLDFPQRDHLRMEELSNKAAEGALSTDERDELEEYLRIADMLAIIQSKARRSLKRAGRGT